MAIALVTGGSNGIGRATALALAARGVGVILTYYNHADRAAAVVQEIQQRHGGQAVALKLNLADPVTFPAFVAEVRHALAKVWQRTAIDYLVNNGGTGGPMMLADLSEEYFNRILDTNYRGPVFLTRELLPLLADGGAIVNTSSSSSRQAFPGYSVYGSLKAALSVWTRYIAKELAPRRIRVNAVSPGPTHTNFGDGAFDRHPEFIEPLAAQTAFGRLGAPEDIARVIAQLLSDDFGWVTAQDIEVSGGHLL